MRRRAADAGADTALGHRADAGAGSAGGHRADGGAVTAELAIGLPVVVLVLGACLGGLAAGTAQLRAHDAAADAARLLGRGEPLARAESVVAQTVAGGRLSVSRADGLVCASVDLEQRVLLVQITVTGRSCALDAGW